MKRSSLFSIALLACAALASVAVSTFDRTVSIAAGVFRGIKDFVLGGIALVAGTSAETKGPAVVLVQAKAFVLRLAKRERPVVTASWRMCPSI